MASPADLDIGLLRISHDRHPDYIPYEPVTPIEIARPTSGDEVYGKVVCRQCHRTVGVRVMSVARFHVWRRQVLLAMCACAVIAGGAFTWSKAAFAPSGSTLLDLVGGIAVMAAAVAFVVFRQGRRGVVVTDDVSDDHVVVAVPEEWRYGQPGEEGYRQPRAD